MRDQDKQGRNIQEPERRYVGSLEHILRLAASPDAKWRQRGREELAAARPLASNDTGLLTVEKHLRMRKVLDAMRPKDVALLVERFVAQSTEQAIAEAHGVTQQAIAKRLRTARVNFTVAFAKHWNEPLDPDDLLVA